MDGFALCDYVFSSLVLGFALQQLLVQQMSLGRTIAHGYDDALGVHALLRPSRVAADSVNTAVPP